MNGLAGTDHDTVPAANALVQVDLRFCRSKRHRLYAADLRLGTSAAAFTSVADRDRDALRAKDLLAKGLVPYAEAQAIITAAITAEAYGQPVS